MTRLDVDTKVRILVDTWFAPRGAAGFVHKENFTEGKISVAYEDHDGSPGTIFDFDPENFEVY